MKSNEGSILKGVGALCENNLENDPTQIKEKKFEKKKEKGIGNEDRNSNGNENGRRKEEEKQKEHKHLQSTSIHEKIMKNTKYCNVPCSGIFI